MATEKKSYSEIVVNATEKIPYEKLLNTFEWEAKRKTIIERDNRQCKTCGSTANLQVHHMEYIVGYLPWEYDTSVFKTLCAECHMSVHSDPRTFIPIYIIIEGRKELFNGTPCKRCSGNGNLPQYRKIENGICFKCRGRRFEELLFHRIEKTK